MKLNQMQVTWQSLTGGVFSAFGGLLGKLCGRFDTWVLSAACFICMVCVNTCGFMMFAKSLNASSSSLLPVLLSSASSYFVSAIIGMLMFSEQTSMLWWFGTTLILLGISVISIVDKPKSE